MSTSHFHHPHFLSLKEVPTAQGTRRVFHFREFTGLEPEPVPLAYSPEMDRTEWTVLEEEIRAARLMWHIAQFRRALRPPIEAAASCWQRYHRASEAMVNRFEALENTQDPDWRRHTLKLVKAHVAALEAAVAFDEAAAAIARLVDDFEEEVGEGLLPSWRTIAGELGIAAEAWEVYPVSAYHQGDEQSGCPLYDRIVQEVDQQQELIQTVGDLTGAR
ncbi:hypothetical protein ACH4PU_31070 [Streptomyces sp. NPDC021100]|uniref:hypothetical protein n=1 Tax=Streptomyces sp. NPDC021100 TaxID=3365114 RepID=UPI0037A5F517